MLVSMKVILADANRYNYGVIALNSFNLETARAGIMAAEAEQSAIIIQVNPLQVKQHARFSDLVPLVTCLAASVSVPVALHFDQATDYYDIETAIERGFTSVMFDGSHLTPNENQQKTEQVVRLAHSHGCVVSAKLGVVLKEGIAKASEGQLGLPELTQAKDFIQQTGVDALVVSPTIVNSQSVTRQVPMSDFKSLALLKKELQLPLVLADTPDLSPKMLKEAVDAGFNKIDVCTNAFKNCTQTMAESLAARFKMDYLAINVAMEKNLKQFVRSYMKILGSTGRYGER